MCFAMDARGNVRVWDSVWPEVGTGVALPIAGGSGCGILKMGGVADSCFTGGDVTRPAEKEESPMHDLMVVLTFIAMVYLPCVIAVKVGAADDEVNAMHGSW